jgi:hypothetical protein
MDRRFSSKQKDLLVVQQASTSSFALAMQNKLDGQQAPPPQEVDPEGQVLD